MAQQIPYLYFLDVYVPENSDPSCALEVAVLCMNANTVRPIVHIHSFLQPQPISVINRYRWEEAERFGISRNVIEHGNFPNFYDIVKADYLKGLDIICFNSAHEAISNLTKNAHSCESLVDIWHRVFRHAKNEARDFTEYEQMLDYIGLDKEDRSNTLYTPLMDRIHAYIAILYYLNLCVERKQVPNRRDPAFIQNPYWPLQNITVPWYSGKPKSLKEIKTTEVQTYFSERLPDFIDWKNLHIYVDDWTFGRKPRAILNVSGQDAMMNYIFFNLFDIERQILVLAFYSLFARRTNYAGIIALHTGDFSSLPNYIKADFSSFMLKHLDDFLNKAQKCFIIESLVSQVVQDNASKTNENIEYLAIYKEHAKKIKKFNSKNSLLDCFDLESCSLDCNKNIDWFIKLCNKGEIIAYYFVITGNQQERDECIDRINAKFREMSIAVKNPFADCWLNEDLKLWIESVTGLPWQKIQSEPRHNDSPTLTSARKTISSIIAKQSKAYCAGFFNNISQCVSKINEGELLDRNNISSAWFYFQGIRYIVIIDDSDSNAGLLRRLFKWI